MQVSNTCSWVIRDREDGGWENPLNCASAAARAVVPFSSISFSAVGVKNAIDSG
jgi:hypothetical protein